MSASYMLVIRPRGASDEKDLIRDLAAILHTDFAPNGAGDGYCAATKDGAVDLFTEDAAFDDEGDLRFSRYPWYVQRQKYRDETWRQRALNQMRQMYHGLVSTGRYGCLLVDEWSLMDTNDPVPLAE